MEPLHVGLSHHWHKQNHGHVTCRHTHKIHSKRCFTCDCGLSAVAVKCIIQPIDTRTSHNIIGDDKHTRKRSLSAMVLSITCGRTTPSPGSEARMLLLASSLAHKSQWKLDGNMPQISQASLSPVAERRLHQVQMWIECLIINHHWRTKWKYTWWIM